MWMRYKRKRRGCWSMVCEVVERSVNEGVVYAVLVGVEMS